MYRKVSGAWLTVIVQGTEIKSKTTFSEIDASIMPLGNTNIHNKIMCQTTLINTISFAFFELNRVAR